MSRSKSDFSLYDKTLPNGVRIIALSMAKADYVSFAVGISAGSRDDPPGRDGTAHLLEHMMMTTTASRPKTRMLYGEFDALGGASNMLTNVDCTQLNINVIREDMPRAAELVFDVLKNARWNRKQLALEKGVIISELQEDDDDPEQSNNSRLGMMLFEGSPLEHRAEGNARSVTSITNSELHAFRDAYYCGENIVVCIAGAISRRDVNRHIVPLFSRFKKGERKPAPNFEASQTEPRVETREKSFKQLWLALGFTFGGMSAKEILTLDVVTSMLGDNAWSSLFFSKIRQAGLAYDINIDADVLQDVGYVTILGSTNHHDDKEALRKIFSILKRIKENVSSKTLQFFKDYTCRQLALEATSAGFHSQDILEEAIRGREILTPYEQIDVVRAVTRKDFLEVTNKVFDFSRTNLSLMGPCRSPNVYRRIIEEFL